MTLIVMTQVIITKAHNDAEVIIKENNIDRFLLNMFMDKKGINKFYTTPELVNEFLNSDWFLACKRVLEFRLVLEP